MGEGGHYYNRWGGNWGTFRSITGHRLVQRGRREMGEGGTLI